MEVHNYPKMSKSLKKLKNKNSIYSPQPPFPKDSGVGLGLAGRIEVESENGSETKPP